MNDAIYHCLHGYVRGVCAVCADPEHECKSSKRPANTALLKACREELLSQWKSNHAEHCTNILPCPQTQAGPLGCQWPRPAVLSLLDERLEK